MELWNSYTFRIDQLIECPREDIKGNKAPLTPTVIEIDGSNDNLIEVGNTFEPSRKSQISYDIGNVLYKNQGIAADKEVEINYTSLKVGESKIYQGGLEYQTILSNQPTQISFAQTMSFNSSSWAHGRNGHANFPPQNVSTGNIDLTTTTWVFGSQIGANYWASASTDSAGGYIRLMGGAYNITGSSTITNDPLVPSPGQYIAGPGLGVLHSMNKRVQLNKRATDFPLVIPPFDDIQIGIPQGITIKQFKAGGDSNYFNWNISQSSETRPENYKINNYEDFEQSFLIEVNDEIRVTFNVNDDATKSEIFEERSYVVTKVGYRGEFGDETTSEFGYYRNAASTIYPLNSASLYDKIYVSPDPTLSGIPNGKIYNFTIRRRVNADDRVIIYQTPPRGTEGIRTLSPTGYLVPGDFSPTQKRNVLTLINQLKAKNTNKANDNSNNNMQS